MQIHEIADTHDIPQHYLEQILVTLKKAGLVDSHRGAQGGYALARRPGRIAVLDILGVLEGPLEGGCVAAEAWRPGFVLDRPRQEDPRFPRAQSRGADGKNEDRAGRVHLRNLKATLLVLTGFFFLAICCPHCRLYNLTYMTIREAGGVSRASSLMGEGRPHGHSEPWFQPGPAPEACFGRQGEARLRADRLGGGHGLERRDSRAKQPSRATAVITPSRWTSRRSSADRTRRPTWWRWSWGPMDAASPPVT